MAIASIETSLRGNKLPVHAKSLGTSATYRSNEPSRGFLLSSNPFVPDVIHLARRFLIADRAQSLYQNRALLLREESRSSLFQMDR